MKEETKRHYRRYDKEFKKSAVKLVLEGTRSAYIKSILDKEKMISLNSHMSLVSTENTQLGLIYPLFYLIQNIEKYLHKKENLEMFNLSK